MKMIKNIVLLFTLILISLITLTCNKMQGPSGELGDLPPLNLSTLVPAANKGLVLAQNKNVLTNNFFDFGNINREGFKEVEFELYNTNSFNVTLTNPGMPIILEGSTSYYSITQMPSYVIPANGKVLFKLMFNSAGNSTFKIYPSRLHIPNSVSGDLVLSLDSRTTWHLLTDDPTMLAPNPPVILANSPGSDSAFAAAVNPSNGFLYVFIHKSNTIYINRYNYTLNKWESMGSFGTGAASPTFMKSIIVNDKAYILIQVTNNLYVFGLDLTSHSLIAGMPTIPIHLNVSSAKTDIFWFNSRPHIALISNAGPNEFQIWSYSASWIKDFSDSDGSFSITSPVSIQIINNKIYTGIISISSLDYLLWEITSTYAPKNLLGTYTPTPITNQFNLNNVSGQLSFTYIDSTNLYHIAYFTNPGWSHQSYNLRLLNKNLADFTNMGTYKTGASALGSFGTLLADFGGYTQMSCLFFLNNGEGFGDTTLPLLIWPLKTTNQEYVTDGIKTHYVIVRHDDSNPLISGAGLQGILVFRRVQ